MFSVNYLENRIVAAISIDSDDSDGQISCVKICHS